MVTPAEIEQRYLDILHQQMKDVAVVNHLLDVSAIGFRGLAEARAGEDAGEQLGVLLTPWFMNLMLLPSAGAEWQTELTGTKTIRHLPSGSYEFIFGWDKVIGGYAMCSLFSPMFEFEDQHAAVVTAEEVLRSLYEAQHQAPTDLQLALAAEREKQQQNQQAERQQTDACTKLEVGIAADESSTVTTVAAKAQQEVELPAQLSRRQFFTAGYGRSQPLQKRSVEEEANG